MAVMNLKSLVLRGVSVLRDGKAVTVRLGFGYAAGSQASGVRTSSVRHSCLEHEPESARRDDSGHDPDNRSALRAGRSDHPACRDACMQAYRHPGSAGALSRTSPTSVGGAGQRARLRVPGGTFPMAFTTRNHAVAWLVAPGNRIPPAALPARPVIAALSDVRHKAQAELAWPRQERAPQVPTGEHGR